MTDGSASRPTAARAPARGPVDVAAFAGAARGERLMGLDLGTKTIGLALSDAERRMAGPLRVIRRVKFGADAADLLAEAARQGVVGLVAGLPLNMDASEGPRAQSARAFMRQLSGLTPLPYAFWDERLSTIAAERELIGRDVSRAKRALVIDAAAAAHILQGALDRLSHLRAQGAGARDVGERDDRSDEPGAHEAAAGREDA